MLHYKGFMPKVHPRSLTRVGKEKPRGIEQVSIRPLQTCVLSALKKCFATLLTARTPLVSNESQTKPGIKKVYLPSTMLQEFRRRLSAAIYGQGLS